MPYRFPWVAIIGLAGAVVCLVALADQEPEPWVSDRDQIEAAGCACFAPTGRYYWEYFHDPDLIARRAAHLKSTGETHQTTNGAKCDSRLTK